MTYVKKRKNVWREKNNSRTANGFIPRKGSVTKLRKGKELHLHENTNALPTTGDVTKDGKLENKNNEKNSGHKSDKNAWEIF